MGASQNLCRDVNLSCEYVDGIVFHPAFVRKMLGKLMLGEGSDFAVVVEKDSAGAGGALVEREDVLGRSRVHHWRISD